MRKVIILLVILIVALSAVGIWYFQRNSFSKGILKLEILAPETITMGDEIEYSVKYRNTGQITLENAKLTFEFPENSLPSDGTNLRIEKQIGFIYPGEEKIVSFKGRLLGKENEIKTAKADILFNPKNLKASFDSTTTMNSQINTVPLTLDFDLGSKAQSGKELNFSLNYFSNCDVPLSNLEIRMQYPSGFTLTSSNPKITDNNWPISTLNKTEGGRINITGNLIGETYQQEGFKAVIGIWEGDQFIVLKESQKTVEIAQSSIIISARINGSDNYKASLGDLLDYEISFKNIGDGPFENLFLTAQLNGDAFDLSSVRTISGQYSNGTNTILFDNTNNPQLKFLDAGEEGTVELWVKLKDSLPNNSQNKNIFVDAQVNVGQVRQTFTTKINAEPIVSQKGLFNNSSFQNLGLPPTIGQPTTYTIYWRVSNFYNDLRNVKVKATLPLQVKLTGEMNPSDARLTFDQNSREIVWDIGDLNLGTDNFVQGPELSFQVSLTPESSQAGQVADLIYQATISGEDVWTDVTVERTAPGINTNLPDDSTINAAQKIVQ